MYKDFDIETVTEDEIKEKAYDLIYDAISDLDDEDLKGMWNSYCEDSMYYDDMVYSFEELDDICCCMSPTTIIEKYGDLEGYDYFTDGTYTEGSNYIKDLIDIGDLVDYIIDNDEHYGDRDIRDLLDEYLECLEELEEYEEAEEEE